MTLLEGDQFVEQLVEFTVGDDRGVLDVVPELVPPHLFSELLPAPAYIGIDHS